MVGVVWFGLEGSEFNIMNQSMNESGRYRAARAAKNQKYPKSCRHNNIGLVLDVLSRGSIMDAQYTHVES